VTIREAIDGHAAARPDAPAILAPEPDRIVTYGQLRGDALALAAALRRRGILPGEVVS